MNPPLRGAYCRIFFSASSFKADWRLRFCCGFAAFRKTGERDAYDVSRVLVESEHRNAELVKDNAKCDDGDESCHQRYRRPYDMFVRLFFRH